MIVIYMNLEEKIREAYYNPLTGLQSAKKLYEKLKKDGITYKQIKEFIDKQETAQLLKPAIKPKVFYPITSYAPFEHIQVDLMDISNVSTTNSNYKFLFVAIDIFTRVLQVVPLKTKTTTAITEAMDKIINFFHPKIVTSDLGSEYTSHTFKSLLKSHDIEQRLVDVNQHASLGLVDRACRTIKGFINKYLTSHKTTKFIDVLDQLIENYNNTYHSTIKCTPNEAEKHIDQINNIMNRKYHLAKEQEQVYDIGQKVRYVLNLNIFEKKSKQRWSDQVCTIVDKKAHSYKLDNGTWYRYYQLLPTEQIEAVEKKGKTTRQKLQTIKKENTSKRRLHNEGVSLENILSGSRRKDIRTRKPTDRFSY